ncbi:uncharacterized protein [Henckelia pumila]|uniref:uncharacterized protein n=1 Tax=Henckelia pumila TaxID=405737 RepID=UPI003C6EA028
MATIEFLLQVRYSKGKRNNIGCLFWLLARMVLLMRGVIASGHMGCHGPQSAQSDDRLLFRAAVEPLGGNTIFLCEMIKVIQADEKNRKLIFSEKILHHTITQVKILSSS